MFVQAFPAVSMPGSAGGEEQAVPGAAQAELSIIRQGGLTLVAGQDSRRSRQRRARPKKRGGAYATSAVENGGVIKGP